MMTGTWRRKKEEAMKSSGYCSSWYFLKVTEHWSFHDNPMNIESNNQHLLPAGICTPMPEEEAAVTPRKEGLLVGLKFNWS